MSVARPDWDAAAPKPATVKATVKAPAKKTK